jgi:type II secretory pathway pseudopilin PulG
MTGAGFTIVETMIFLAISGMMFVLAISAMSGKQQQTEFQTGVNTLRAELNQDLSNVGSGNYPSLNGINCIANVNSGQPDNCSTLNPINDTSTVIGEVLAFKSGSYTILPVVGRNYVAGTNDTQDATSFSQAEPWIISSTAQSITMPFGLTVVSDPSITSTVTSPAISPTDLGAIGIFSFTSFEGNNLANSGEALSSGSEHVEIFAIPGSKLNTSPIGLVNTPLTNCSTASIPDGVCTISTAPAQMINPSNGITLCLNSGSDTQSVFFTIGGGSNSATSVSDTIYSTLGCQS